MPNTEGEVEQPRRSVKDTPQNIAKLKELRGYAPFIKNVVKTYKRQMTIDRWRKLHMLAELLESKTTATEFFNHFPTEKLNKIEGIIDKLKSNFGSLLHPNDVIEIKDGENNMSGSHDKGVASNKYRPPPERKSNPSAPKQQSATGRRTSTIKTATTSSSTKSASTTSETSTAKVPTVAPVAKNVATRKTSTPTVTASKPAATAAANTQPQEMMRKSNPPAPAGLEPEAKNVTAPVTPTKPKPTIPLRLEQISPSGAERRVNPPAPNNSISTSTPLSIPKPIIESVRVEAAKPDFERRSNPPMPTIPKPAVQLHLDFPTISTPKERSQSISSNRSNASSSSSSSVFIPTPIAIQSVDQLMSPIGKRREDFMHRSNLPAPIAVTVQSSVAHISSPPVAPVFERRTQLPASDLIPVAKFTRRSNPPAPPPVVLISPLASIDVTDTTPSLLEARKKLAKLTSSFTNNSNNNNSTNNNTIISPLTSPAVAVATTSGTSNVCSPPPALPLPHCFQQQNHASSINTNSTGNCRETQLSSNINIPLLCTNPEFLPVDESATFGGPQQATERRFNPIPVVANTRDPRCQKWINAIGSNNNNNNNNNASNNNNNRNNGGQQQQLAVQARREAYEEQLSWQMSNQTSSIYSSYNNNNTTSNTNNSINGNNSNPITWTNNNNSSAYNRNNNKGNFSYRGGYNNKRGGLRFPSSPGGPVPSTYREYLEAKAKKQVADKQRQNEVERQRLLEAAEKKRQLDELNDALAKALPSAPTVGDSEQRVHLDTSYRNLSLTAPKKIDYRIPKKVQTVPGTKDKSKRPEETPVVEGNGAAERAMVDGNKKKHMSLSRVSPEEENWNDCEVSATLEGIQHDTSNKKQKEKEGGGDKDISRVEKPHKTADKAHKTSKKDKSNKSKERDNERAEMSDGNTEKVNNVAIQHTKFDSDKEKFDKVGRTGKKHKSHKKSKAKKEKKNESEKDTHVHKKDKNDDNSNVDKFNVKEDTEKGILPQADNTDNVENEPPRSTGAENKPESDEEFFQTYSKSKFKKRSQPKELEQEEDEAKVVDKPKEINAEDNENEDVKVEDVIEEAETKMPVLPKIKVVLGPNAHTMVVIPSDAICSMQTNEADEAERLKRQRIIRRRKSMMPESSRPLVDKQELFTASSLDYEDFVEHQRDEKKKVEDGQQPEEEADKQRPAYRVNAQQRINKNLATMFEKTSDNCRISTQNILVGKRRTRVGDITLNEIQLSRNCFKQSAILKTPVKPARVARSTTPIASTADKQDALSTTAVVATPTAVVPASSTTVTDLLSPVVKRKRGRPAKNPPATPPGLPNAKRARLESRESLKTSDAREESVSRDGFGVERGGVALLPPPAPRRKRSELEKLNEDIAQMYYAEDVLRATGRRACTAKQRMEQQQSLFTSSDSNSNSSWSSSSYGGIYNNPELAPYIRNVARRGRSFRIGKGLSRQSFKAKQKLQQKRPMRRCNVRLERCPLLEQLILQRRVRNTNPEWHSMSSATEQCVVCGQSIRFPIVHYMKLHDELYASRFPPGILQNLRAGISNRPVYAMRNSQNYNLSMYHQCPFCQKTLTLSNSLWFEHFSRHTGEFRYQCSHCRFPRQRANDIENHVAKCADDARVLVRNKLTYKYPLYIHVCHLCDFVQLSRKNLEEHWQRQHSLQPNSLLGLGQKLVLYRVDGVPQVDSENAAKMLRRRQTAMNKEALKNPSKKQQPAEGREKKKTDAKWSSSVAKCVLIEQEQLGIDQDMNENDDSVEIMCPISSNIGMPPTVPGEEQLLVINECKLEQLQQQEEEMVNVLHLQELQPQEQEVQQPPESMQAEEELSSLPTSITKMETSFAIGSVLDDLVDNLSGIGSDPEEEPQDQEEPQQVQNEAQLVQKEPQIVQETAQLLQEEPQLVQELLLEQEDPQQQLEETQLEPVEPQLDQEELQLVQEKAQQHQEKAQLEQEVPRLEQEELQQPQEKAQPEQQMEQEEVAEVTQADDWIDLDDDNSNTQKKPAFSSYKKIYSRWMSSGRSVSSSSSASSTGAGGRVRTGSSRQSKSPSASNCSESEVPDVECTSVLSLGEGGSANRKSPASNYSDSEVPDPVAECTTSVPTLGIPSSTNVRNSIDVPIVETVHSEIDVPIVEAVHSTESVSETMASVSTVISPAHALISVQNVGYRLRTTSKSHVAYYCLTNGCTFLFSNELEGLENHFAREHPQTRWNGSCSNCPEREQTEQQAEQSIREELRHLVLHHMDKATAPALVPVVPPSAPAQKTDPVVHKLRVRRFTGDRLAESEAEAVTQQLQQEQSEVVQEFGLVNANTMLRDLLANPSHPPSVQQMNLNSAGVGEYLIALPTAVTEPATAAVVNHPSELNLAIDQVFSLTDLNKLADKSLKSGLSNGDFVLTHSVTQNFDGQAPAEINISLQSVPMPPSEPAQPPATTAQRTHLIADRFRCMAPNCNYCAHTVMCIREHMRFHSYSFGNKDYLRCAYCTYVARDVNDYVHHGVIEHGLASRSDLLEPNQEPSAKSQLIRNMLNKSRTASAITNPNNNPGVSLASGSAVTNTGSTDASKTSRDLTALIGIVKVIEDLLEPTGFSDNKLFACPHKGCSSGSSLTEETFGNHVFYHMSSNARNLSQINCKFCTQKFDGAFALRDHLLRMHKRHRYFCSICLETTANPRLMLHHMHTAHPVQFRLINCQQQFVPLPSTQGDSTPDIDKIWVSAVEQPFGPKEMEAFLCRLVDEKRLRSEGKKLIYRPSELRLLSRMTEVNNKLKCAKCHYGTSSVRQLFAHLHQHMNTAVHLAYEKDNLCSNSLKKQATEPTATVIDLSSPDENDDSPGTATPEPALASSVSHLPSKQIIHSTRHRYVPKEMRFACGVIDCGEHLKDENTLRQHLTTKHSYVESYKCPLCASKEHKVLVEKIIEHLSIHKRHLYQCGGCNTFNPKRQYIDRHISQSHPGQNIDIIIHRREVDESTQKIRTQQRWLKPIEILRYSSSQWICNLCQLVLSHQHQMVTHAQRAHGKSFQYHCPYCDVGGNYAVGLIQHMRRRHADKRPQPVSCYQQMRKKNRHTLGFYCNHCDETSNTYQRMRQHCEAEHNMRYQYMCSHCKVGNGLERALIGHATEAHAGQPGLAVQQFERVANEQLDSHNWDLAMQISELNENTVTATEGGKAAVEAKPTETEAEVTDDGEQPIEMIELILSSDEEEELDEQQCEVVPSSIDGQKTIKYACSHCHETSSNVNELRTKHWALKHPEKPFYFTVQPQLCCPQCYGFVGNAKTLLEEHLPKAHSIQNLVACDVRHLKECGYCEQPYNSASELARHMAAETHLPNDLKNLTDSELNVLLRLSTGRNEYFQCEACRIIVPTMEAMNRHIRVQHNLQPPNTLKGRQIKNGLIYHCPFCMYASSTEMVTLHHMLDHYKKFNRCQLCLEDLNDGFDEYIEHCYTNHRDVHRFEEMHPFTNLKKFLSQVLYQFQNGLIISKSSLRKTSYSDERCMVNLYMELKRKAEKPPIPRILIIQRQNYQKQEQAVPGPARIVQRRKTCHSLQQLKEQVMILPQQPQEQPKGQLQQHPKPARTVQRRKTLCAENLQQHLQQMEFTQQQQQPQQEQQQSQQEQQQPQQDQQQPQQEQQQPQQEQQQSQQPVRIVRRRKTLCADNQLQQLQQMTVPQQQHQQVPPQQQQQPTQQQQQMQPGHIAKRRKKLSSDNLLQQLQQMTVPQLQQEQPKQQQQQPKQQQQQQPLQQQVKVIQFVQRCEVINLDNMLQRQQPLQQQQQRTQQQQPPQQQQPQQLQQQQQMQANRIVKRRKTLCSENVLHQLQQAAQQQQKQQPLQQQQQLLQQKITPLSIKHRRKTITAASELQLPQQQPAQQQPAQQQPAQQQPAQQQPAQQQPAQQQPALQQPADTTWCTSFTGSKHSEPPAVVRTPACPLRPIAPRPAATPQTGDANSGSKAQPIPILQRIQKRRNNTYFKPCEHSPSKSSRH